MGLEMLPSKHYAVWREDRAEGTAWVYSVGDKVAVVKFDGEKIFSATSKFLIDVDAADLSDQMQDFICNCADRDVPIDQAREMFLKRFGPPDLILKVADVNDVSPEVRAAVGF
ncbi:hypothetical protein [Corynebacterium tapiri]|uniref:Uncharacterized protein n=1 Tax=Corynebacterium tapiri TaxID=1448266 RepID=A0A5C4U241_9CORY|nr:hypothetical protein [Corynebacterium tapiri]TNL96083.1 hypothetical protein FHE74_08630 [Corynebacterium tapiri]